MATRSYIIVKRATDYARIYCHSDGYLSHNGIRLYEHWNSQEKAEALIALGDLSTLGTEIGEKHDFDWYSKLLRKYSVDRSDEMTADPDYIRFRPMCKAYGRDRGEKGTEAYTAATFEAVKDSEEYVYVWDGKEWQVSQYERSFERLEDALVAEGLIEAPPPVPVAVANTVNESKRAMAL